MKINRITIIGVGLIGGSLGMAVKHYMPGVEVVGVTAHKETIEAALRSNAIDIGMLNAGNSVKDSDLIIISTPVNSIIKMFKSIKPHLKRGSIIIDVGSVKAEIVDEAEKLSGGVVYFVGVHPMAGSEKRGIRDARFDLFQGAPCIITKTNRTNKEALVAVTKFWKRLGSKVYVLSPSEHDCHISGVSHIVHIAASALCLIADAGSLKFASSGFRDTTRVASSDSNLWAPILLANRKNLSRDIKRLIKVLNEMNGAIAAKDGLALRRKLKSAKRLRDQFKAV